MFFRIKPKVLSYDSEKVKPVLRRSICTGETTAGFRKLHGERKYREVMLIQSDRDLQEFMDRYGITTPLDTEY